MEGLEKITAQILADAKASCDKSYEDAKAEIEQIKKKYNDEAAQIIADAEADAQKERESIVSRGLSSAAMLRRNMLLQSKSKMVDKGGYFLMAALPIGVVGLISAIHQAKVAASGVSLIAKQKNEVGKAITSSALVETYAIFALLVSLLLIIFYKG